MGVARYSEFAVGRANEVLSLRYGRANADSEFVTEANGSELAV